jgi:TrmH family RNA methyltransferase
MIKRNLHECKACTLTMPLIQSSSNPRVQRIRKLLKDRKQSQFIVEGKKLIQEAWEAGIHFEEILVTPALHATDRVWINQFRNQGTTLDEITPRLLKSISDVETPQGILGVAQKPKPLGTLSLKSIALLLISIRDPGNFGAIVRTAEACGCEWIGHSSDTVDPFQPKVVRSSMGSLFRVPMIEIKDTNAFLQEKINQNISTCGLEPRGGKAIASWKPSFPLIVCIGSESHGLPPDLPVADKLTIPMKGKVESLNAAVAAGICLYTISLYASAGGK